MQFFSSLDSAGLARLSLFLLVSCFCFSASHGQSLTALALTPGQAAVAIGSSTQLTATATFSDGQSHDVSNDASWASDDLRVATVSATGVVSGVATGAVVVSARYQDQSSSILVSSSIGAVAWSGPLTITQGGTYSGDWRSTDANIPAVTVATTAPVVIQNSHLSGPNDLISDPYYGNKLTVRNVIGICVNPNVKGQGMGVFVNAQNPAFLDVENSYFENVSFGVEVRNYAGSRDGIETVTIVGNRGRNILGVLSDGNGGYLSGENYWQWAHAIQFDGMPSVPGINIAWNEIINYPYQSLVNENVNMYDAGGTAASPALFHDNYIQGAYAYSPATDSYNGGGFVTDGSGSDTPATASSYHAVYNNQIVATTNMAIEFSTGHDNVAYNNKVVASGLLPNGSKLPAQNVGLSIYDTYGNMANGSMYNNFMHDNVVGWMCWAARCAWDGYRNDEYFPSDTADYSTNQSIAANPITRHMETQEYSAWLKKLLLQGIVTGPFPAN